LVCFFCVFWESQGSPRTTIRKRKEKKIKEKKRKENKTKKQTKKNKNGRVCGGAG